MRPRSQAFSIVEILAVAGILAVLSAVLLPVLARAKVAAKGASAVLHLRQTALAWTMYAVDWDDTAMPPRSHLGGRRYAYWWALYDEATGETDPRGGLLYPYTRGEGVQADPNWPDRLRVATGATGFGYNHRYLGTGRARLGQVADPAATVAFAASARVGFLPPHRLEGNTYLEPPSADYPTFHGRANGKGAVAWCDGHVAPRAPAVRLGAVGSWPPGFFARHSLGEIDADGDFRTDELFDLD